MLIVFTRNMAQDIKAVGRWSETSLMQIASVNQMLSDSDVELIAALCWPLCMISILAV